MAKKRQAVVTEEPTRELDNTLLVDGTKYNINAVKADSAELAKKVEHALSIKCLGLDGEENADVNFDGSDAKSLEIVAASGGRFNSGIRVPANTNDIDPEDVLNYGDTKTKVVDDIVKDLANTSISYIWDGHELSAIFDIPADAINKINSVSIVVGDDAGVETFAANNSDKGWLPTYLYLCAATEESSGNIYFGTKNSDTAVKLVSSTDYAEKAGTADLATSAVSLTSTLLIEGGGTSATTAAEAATNIITNQNIAPKTVQLKPKNNTTGGQYRWVIPAPESGRLEYATYRSDDDSVYDGGIDLANSDLTNLNGVWFADAANAKGEGIMFLRRNETSIPFKLRVEAFTDVDNNKTVFENGDEWDRLYANNGELYLIQKENVKSAGTQRKFFHDGSDFSNVTVGKANVAATIQDSSGNNILNNYQQKIITGTVDPNSANAPDAVKKAGSGAIYIMYNNS